MNEENEGKKKSRISQMTLDASQTNQKWTIFVILL